MSSSALFYSLQRTHSHHVLPVLSWSRCRQLGSSTVVLYRVPSTLRTMSGLRVSSNCSRTIPVQYLGLYNRFSHKAVRLLSTGQQQSSQWDSSSKQRSANRNTLMYVIAVAIAVTGLSYAAVPLYRAFCQATGYGGTVVKIDAGEKVEKMEPIKERELTIR